jgi:hypothetical protein
MINIALSVALIAIAKAFFLGAFAREQIAQNALLAPSISSAIRTSVNQHRVRQTASLTETHNGRQESGGIASGHMQQ